VFHQLVGAIIAVHEIRKLVSQCIEDSDLLLPHVEEPFDSARQINLCELMGDLRA
jgi:hypothetical protein